MAHLYNLLVMNYGLRPARRLRLKNNFDIVKIACIQNGFALYYASNELKNNEIIVKIACKQNSDVLKYASNELQIKLTSLKN